METKILISILISAVLLVSIGIVMAHGTDRNSDRTEIMNKRGMSMHMNGMHDMGDMPEEMEEMMGEDEHMSMMKTMNGNMGEMHEEMISEMKEMMDNETLREEMSEHMKSCPMMKGYYSS